MRILFSFAGGAGHALPMMPLARALSTRGHAVLFTCQAGMVEWVAQEGFRARDSGGRTLAPASMRRPVAGIDRAAEIRVVQDSFAGSTARTRMPRVRQVAAQFKADLIVRDELDLGAAVAAESMGIPHISVVILAAGGLVGPGLLDEQLQRLCAEAGLTIPPGFADRYLTLVPVMPSFRDPRAALPASAMALAPAGPGEPGRGR